MWSEIYAKLECGPTWWPPCRIQMATSVQRRKVWLTSLECRARVPCSNAAKTRNPLKFAGVPQTGKPISAASGPKFTILSGHVEEVLLLNSFYRLSMCTLVAKIYPDKVVRWCPDGDFLAIFLRLVFSPSRVQHVSDLCPKFAPRPHHVWKYGRHPICDGWD